MDYINYMIELRQTEEFQKWRTKLKDGRARSAIASRLDRLLFGQFGDVSPVGNGVSELRIHYGPGYRVYFQQQARRSSSCCAAATKARRPGISKPRNVWPMNGVNEHEQKTDYLRSRRGSDF
jgi:putative addiction module killer protein